MKNKISQIPQDFHIQDQLLVKSLLLIVLQISNANETLKSIRLPDEARTFCLIVNDTLYRSTSKCFTVSHTKMTIHYNVILMQLIETNKKE